jgi:ribosome-binding factor A
MAHKSFSRSDRITELVSRTIGQVLLTDSKDPRFKSVSISRVDLTKDRKKAFIYVTLFEPEHKKEILESLNHAASYFRQALAKACDLKYTPSLEFVYDEVILKASRLYQIISDIE